MSPSKTNSHSSSNRNGENFSRQTPVLASAYCVDTSANLTGFHYSTTGAGGSSSLPAKNGLSGIPEVRKGQGIPSPPTSPPLAALTSANELALITNSKRDTEHGRKRGRGKGAAYTIRGECERLFCETLKGVFLGEEGPLSNGSIESGVRNLHSSNNTSQDKGYFAIGSNGTGHNIDAYIEFWDYAGGCSFRGFVGGNGENKSLFAFFDSAVIGSQVKQGLMALVDLAETVFAVSQLVICVDRSVPEHDLKVFLRGLRWVGFAPITLDTWASDLDVTSNKWIFLGMEI